MGLTKYHPIVVDHQCSIKSFCKQHLPNLGYSQLFVCLRKKLIRTQSGKIATTKILQATDQVFVLQSLFDKYTRQSSIADCNPILHRCIVSMQDDFVVVNKPKNLACQRGTGTELSLCDLLKPILAQQNGHPHLVHRLDKPVSGLMVVATNYFAAKTLSSSVGGWKKVYVASVPVCAEPFLAYKTHRSVEANVEAITQYKVVKSCKDYSTVHFVLITGRKHQIRKHCLEIFGVPITGDKRYGSLLDCALQLHCWSLEFQYKGQTWSFVDNTVRSLCMHSLEYVETV